MRKIMTKTRSGRLYSGTTVSLLDTSEVLYLAFLR